MKILYINADFDEHGLETKMYETVESFVRGRIGIRYSLEELKTLAQEPEENPDEVFVLELLLSGQHEGEWSTEEVWTIQDGVFKQGLV
ncbi:MAG: hypothetical protein RR959_07200 [Erysipelotrichaceae bacterium]